MSQSFTPARTALATIALAGSLIAAPAVAAIMVGGAPMYPTKTIVENAVNSKDHTTLVAAVKAAGLVETLNTGGPFTAFAPVNAGFAALPAGTVDTLLMPENKASLTGVLTYHVVPARLTHTELADLIQANGGKAELTTVAGAKLIMSMNGPANIIVTDSAGNVANVVTYDVLQSNGVIHSIDKVMLPN